MRAKQLPSLIRMSSDTAASSSSQRRERDPHVLFVLFRNDDVHMKFLMTSCVALQFHVTVVSHLPDIEQSIKTQRYEIILVDTRTHTSSTVVKLLKLLTKHAEASLIMALWSPGAGADHRSKLHFLLALLRAGVDRILQETDHLLSYFAQLLFMREIDEQQQRARSLGEAMSAIVHQWPQPIQIVNPDFDLLYQNLVAEKRFGKVGDSNGESFVRVQFGQLKQGHCSVMVHRYSSWKKLL